MDWDVKSRPARIKATDDTAGDKGEFSALVAVFGNVDSVGDRIMPGAFTETLKEWEASGDPIPVLWSHMSSDPDYHIGEVVEAKETDDGLLVKGRIDLDAPKAAQVWRLLKGRRVTQFSFAYDVQEAAPVVEDGEPIFELRRLKLYEVGPTLIGANQQTELIDTKALDRITRGLKEGRMLSAKNLAQLKSAHTALGEVIAAAEPDDDGKATAAPGEVKAGSSGETEGPTRSPAMIRLSVQRELLDID